MAKPLKVNLEKIRAGQSVWLRRGDDFIKVRIVKRGLGWGHYVHVELPEKNDSGKNCLLCAMIPVPYERRHNTMEWLKEQRNSDDIVFYNRIPREYKRDRSIFGYDRSAFVVHKRHSTGATPDTLVVQPQIEQYAYTPRLKYPVTAENLKEPTVPYPEA